MNSAVMPAHVLVPTSMRPYAITDNEIRKLYRHDAAPGPLDTDVMTMRARPFWMNTDEILRSLAKGPDPPAA